MITSPANERIKFIRKLQERKTRQESGLFVIEGLRILAEAAAQNTTIEMLIAAPGLLQSSFGQQLLEEQRARGVSVLEVSDELFQRISVKDGPQGLAAVVRQQWRALADLRPMDEKTWVALDSIADPGNLGTILRTQDATGGPGVILLDQSTDPYDPAAVRGSMGALFTQALVRASFDELIDWLRQHDCPLVGTSDHASEDYHTYRYPSRMTLLMGSERHGLQPHHLARCSSVVRIPMLGQSDSLNLAVATAVTLYEILNQRREKQ